jgi:hypothetical protein
MILLGGLMNTGMNGQHRSEAVQVRTQPAVLTAQGRNYFQVSMTWLPLILCLPLNGIQVRMLNQHQLCSHTHARKLGGRMNTGMNGKLRSEVVWKVLHARIVQEENCFPGSTTLLPAILSC